MLVPIFTRPTSSYDVLERVKALAREEPKRITMYMEFRSRNSRDCCEPALGYPRCGTVGCVGGWSAILLGMVSMDSVGNPVMLSEVARVMGLTDRQLQELFFPQNSWVKWSEEMGAQTPEYAERVCSHITEFQEKYERQLQNHLCQVNK